MRKGGKSREGGSQRGPIRSWQASPTAQQRQAAAGSLATKLQQERTEHGDQLRGHSHSCMFAAVEMRTSISLLLRVRGSRKPTCRHSLTKSSTYSAPPRHSPSSTGWVRTCRPGCGCGARARTSALQCGGSSHTLKLVTHARKREGCCPRGCDHQRLSTAAMSLTHLGRQAAIAVHIREVHLAARSQHAVHLTQHTGLVR
jgi:hypothetical protein